MTVLSERLLKVLSTSVFRLTAVAAVLFLASAGVIVALLFWQTNAVLTDQTLAIVRAEAELLRSEAAGGDLRALTQTVSALSRPQGPGLYYLTDARGLRIAGNLTVLPPELAQSTAGGVFRYQRAAGAEPQHRLGVAIPVRVGPSLRLFVGRDIEDQRAFAETMKRVFLIGFGALGLVALAGGLTVGRLFLNRMDAITETSRSIVAGDLTQRIPVDGSGGELDALARNLNDMLDRIESLMTGLREVSDNIAHDLKTPINRLRNAAEAALMDPRGGPAYREGLERTIEKADDVIKTFNALLLIARLEARPLEDNVEVFSLGALVSDVAELYMPAAEEAGFHLAVETGEGPSVKANRQLAGQAIANLIDNAIKYSRGQQAGRAITVRAGRGADGGVRISVADRGPGIKPADRARVLKRFVRLEASRTAPGTGLGLSLVAAVARLHGGSVELEDNEPGLRVVLNLPARIVVGDAAQARPLARVAM